MKEIIEVESEGETLLVRDHRPNVANSSGVAAGKTLVWIHGLGEHGGRYDHLCDELSLRGWRVITPDLRGHGRSTGTRTHIRTFDEYARDITAIWKQLDLQSDSTVLGAHSMGALVALRAVQRRLIVPSALVVTSPLLGVRLPVPRWKKMLGKLLVGVYPKARFRNGLDPHNMTRDPEFTRQRDADPLIVKTVTASWFFAMQAAMKQAHRDAHMINVPMLAICGELDRTTDADVLRLWLETISSPHRELIMLPDHVHEMIHEADWRNTLDHIVNWHNNLPAEPAP